MKHVVSLCILGLLCCLSASVKAEQPFVIAVNDAYQDAVSVDEMSALFEQLYAPLNIKPTIHYYPSKRGLLLANRLEIDAEAGRVSAVAKHYDNLLMVPEPIFRFSLQLYCLDKRKCQATPESVVGMVGGFQAGPAYCKANNFSCLLDRDAGFLVSALMSGGVDVLAGSQATLQHMLCKLDVETIYYREEKETAFVAYHLVNRNHAGIVDALSESIRSMHARNVFTDFFKKVRTKPANCPIEFVKIE
ncbi:hypothetical protein [Alteromonas facilis]|uniref:hypothetical protein n=1 Tax=Alteromonas facilis TaxID=2048004 RepID=UPI000C28B194|nr:hypothetical protein [Alteromonas facilis]